MAPSRVEKARSSKRKDNELGKEPDHSGSESSQEHEAAKLADEMRRTVAGDYLKS